MLTWRRTGILFIASLLFATSVRAQQNQGGNQGNNNNNNGGQLIAGIRVDPSGVITFQLHRDPNGKLTRDRIAASKKMLGSELARATELRYVSINKLEAAVDECIATGKPIPDEMSYLAGLTGIRYVFYLPESHDIVIAGPAEGFVQDLSGRPVGMDTGRSVLELQDLVVAMRSFAPHGSRSNVISVSIDATQEGLANMQKYYTEVAPRATPKDAKNIAAGMKKSLGLQNVTIHGISPRTHFALGLVEADYRMKLIGIGLEAPAVKIDSYVSRANPQQIARNAMERWFFVPNYECVSASDDGMAMELIADGVKLIGENEIVAANGVRANSGQINQASQDFVADFTKKYPELAAKTPVYSQLKNMIDMSVAAAYIQHQDFYSQAGWQMDVFSDEQRFPVETYDVPKQVESAVNVVWKGKLLMTPIGGGVQIKAQEALLPTHMRFENQRNQAARAEAQTHVRADRWWWD